MIVVAALLGVAWIFAAGFLLGRSTAKKTIVRPPWQDEVDRADWWKNGGKPPEWE